MILTLQNYKNSSENDLQVVLVVPEHQVHQRHPFVPCHHHNHLNQFPQLLLDLPEMLKLSSKCENFHNQNTR